MWHGCAACTKLSLKAPGGPKMHLANMLKLILMPMGAPHMPKPTCLVAGALWQKDGSCARLQMSKIACVVRD